MPTVLTVPAMVVAVALSVWSPAAAFNAGFVAVAAAADADAGAGEVGVWYPSVDAETAGKLGPFAAAWAWDGAAADGKFPVIVLSHGHTGRYRNHRQTAAALARNGFVVAAPDHLADARMTSKKMIVPTVSVRAQELKRALSAVKSPPRIGGVADTGRVGALGYSLGTMTALYAAGATPSIARFDQHCIAHHRDDKNFCRGGWASSFFARVQSALSWLKEKVILKPKTKSHAEKEFPPLASPINFSAIALVAPVGAPFDAAALRALTADIALYRLADDDQLAFPHHAEHLNKLLGGARVYKTFFGVHHHAFISPFPKWLLEAEHIPVAHDPDDFDRATFIRDINADIVEFFRAHL